MIWSDSPLTPLLPLPRRAGGEGEGASPRRAMAPKDDATGAPHPIPDAAHARISLLPRRAMRGCAVRGRGISVLLLALLALTACGTGEAAPVKSYKKAYPKDAVVELPAADGREPGQLPTVPGETVVGRTGPDGAPFEVALRSSGDPTHLTRRFGSRAMDLGARVRQPDLRQHPCTSCHVEGGVLPGVDRVTDAHRNIQPVHPRETGATCTGCHAADNVSQLALGNGERASLDHAYRLCAQCHSPQVEDWAAGAHGKRLDGWQGRRVVMGCADCHDPHSPTLDKRIPFRPPHIPRSGGRDR
jgi:hypothetical protein